MLPGMSPIPNSTPPGPANILRVSPKKPRNNGNSAAPNRTATVCRALGCYASNFPSLAYMLLPNNLRPKWVRLSGDLPRKVFFSSVFVVVFEPRYRALRTHGIALAADEGQCVQIRRINVLPLRPVVADVGSICAYRDKSRVVCV